MKTYHSEINVIDTTIPYEGSIPSELPELTFLPPIAKPLQPVIISRPYQPAIDESGEMMSLEPISTTIEEIDASGKIMPFKPIPTTIEGTESADILLGTMTNDWMQGYAGDDHLTGDAGNDSLDTGDGNDTADGGPGNDWLNGGEGDDTYLFGAASGDDTIFDGAGGNDKVILKDLAQADVSFENIDGLNLKITINATGEYLYVNNVFNADNKSSMVESFQFSDGTLDLAQISALSTLVHYGYETISGTDQSEILTGTGQNEWIDAGQGDDTVNGNSGYDQLIGGEGNDVLNGDTDSDTLQGDAGNDLLDGGAGDDWLYGGGGDDTYLFTTNSGNDSIFDGDKSGTGGNDLVILKDLAQADVSFESINNSDLKITVNATGEYLYINSTINAKDSNAAMESFQFSDGTLDLAQVVDLSTKTYYGYAAIMGTDGADLLTGTDRDEWIDAGLDDDTVNSDAGNDQVIGGEGNDNLNGGNGSDMLQGDAGNDSLDGGAGDDWLYGGAGDDTYLFSIDSGNDFIYEYSWDNLTSSGSDKVIFKNLAQADVSFEKIDGIDLRMTLKETGESLYIYNAYNTDTDSNIETFNFSDGSLNLDQVSALSTEIFRVMVGTEGDDVLTGGKDDNTLEGLAGNDSLDGGAGYDWLSGGLGDDTYFFGRGSGDDTISENGKSVARGNDLVIFKDVLQSDVSFEKIASGFITDTSDESPEQTNAFALRIIINDTGESLYIDNGYTGDNHAVIESFQFSDGTLNLEQILALSKEVIYPIYYAYSAEGGYLDDKAMGGGTGASVPSGSVFRGDSEDNHLNGTSKDDALNGRIGKDVLNGYAGNDRIRGGRGNDQLNGGDGDDKLCGGIGTDRLSGNSGNDRVNGRQGNDHLNGNDGIDRLNGGFGDDLLNGGVGNDILNGGAGDDRLMGGKGSDILAGKDGNDLLIGGGGLDIFLFNSLSGVDTIKDFKVGKEFIQLDSTVFSALTVGELANDSFLAGKNVVARDSNDYLLYNTSNGALFYDADGNGSVVSVKIASLVGVTGLDHTDFVVI